MKKKIIIFICTFLLFLNISANEKILKYDEYLKLINENLPELKLYENNLQKAETSLKKSYAAFDPALSASTSYIRKKPYTDSTSSEADPTNSLAADLYLKTILPSGTRLSIGGEYTMTNSTGENTITSLSMSGISEDEILYNNWTYDPVIKISVTQPVLNNWFGFIDRYSVKDAKNNLAVEKLKKQENENSLETYYKKLYFRWIENITAYKLLNDSIQNLKKTEIQTKDMMNKGLAEHDDYQRAKYSIIKYEQQIKNAEYNINTIKNELKLYFIVDNYIPDISKLNKYYSEISNEKIIYQDFNTTRSSKILNLNKKSLEDLKKIKKNSALPSLDLFANIDIKFHRYNNVTDNEYQNENYNGDVDMVMGIQFSYPLGSIKSRNEIKEVQNMITDMTLQYEITENSYDKNITNMVNYYDALNQIINLKKEGIISLKSIHKIEKNKYNQGRIELRNLLETENSIFDEEIGLISSKVSFINLYLDYKLLIE